MLRRLAPPAAVIVSLAAMVVPAQAGSPLTTTVRDDFYDPAVGTTPLENEGVRWLWGPGGSGTTNQHTVTQDKKLFKSGAPATNDTLEIAASAGKYPYHCKVHGQAMTGRLQVSPRLENANPATGDVVVAWATARETGNRFDVQRRVDGGPWKPFLSNQRPMSVELTGLRAGRTFEWRARSKLKAAPTRKSGWSPPSSAFITP